MELIGSVLGELFTPQGGWSLRLITRVVLSTLILLGYVIVLARLYGSRTFASFTSYDFLVNVAAGSLVASAILGRSLIEPGLSLLVLVTAQWAISAASARSRRMQRTFDNAPVVLIENGHVLPDALRRSRVARASLDQALRSSGLTGPEQAKFAVLESGGTISVVPGQS
ncbi:DUF421 domain-containing protein [Deinococcus knuensis]|uniref:DUF421 domain-containing protein n=1 Tax=Deinococcus knuensis TaxID=1837380 RepID=A0ABQ2SEC0_9DEIO|nr:YetF domain-containing protein [Deinococcus knuensis]GGS22896.1 DUF421 domain-containing protein [Deinococcus knuensis]